MIVNVERAQNSGRPKKFFLKTGETVGLLEYAARRSHRPLSLRVTAEWEFLGEDFQFTSHFGESRHPPPLDRVRHFFVPGNSRKSAKDLRRKESVRLLPDFLR